LNQRLQWQLNNLTRRLRFVFLDLNQNQLKLMIFTDVAFANTIDLHSQIDYVICLTNDVHANLIHWSSIKCKRITRSVLTIELYAMINDFDVEAVIKSIIASTNPESAKKLDFGENGENQRSIHFSAESYIFQRKLKFSI
jgi:hypothetical protein